jgi:hypothetical protein
MPMKQRAVKVDDADWGEWTRQAEEAGLSIGAWIRERCNQNGEDVSRTRDVPVVEGRVDTPSRPAAGSLEDTVNATVARKNGHELGCACIFCERVRTMLMPKRRE